MQNLKRKTEKMQWLLEKVGLGEYTVVWIPNSQADREGYINVKTKTIIIHSETEKRAWEALTHEILELKFRSCFKAYRKIINSLLDVIEEMLYERKEHFLNEIPQILKIAEQIRKGEEP